MTTPYAVGIAASAIARHMAAVLASGIEPGRLAAMGQSILTAGCSARSPLLGRTVSEAISKEQHQDGGWSDVEESLWCLGYLKSCPGVHRGPIEAGLTWVTSQRGPEGGLGKTSRDRARIPLTGLACALCPEVVGERDLDWLWRAWEADLNGPTQLTYKAGFFLLGCAHPLCHAAPGFVLKTINYLRDEQNGGGGFGPWKDHPCGSDPWSTGVVLWGLSCVPTLAPRDVLQRAVEWLEQDQLPNGLWPYHPIDEGSSLALIGLSKALPLLD